MSDLISRKAAIDAIQKLNIPEDMCVFEIMSHIEVEIATLPSAQPDIIRCKDCKHWKDSDGIYRRGVDAESKCPLNTKEVYDGTFYCGYAERRPDGSD